MQQCETFNKSTIQQYDILKFQQYETISLIQISVRTYKRILIKYRFLWRQTKVLTLFTFIKYKVTNNVHICIES